MSDDVKATDAGPMVRIAASFAQHSAELTSIHRRLALVEQTLARMTAQASNADAHRIPLVTRDVCAECTGTGKDGGQPGGHFACSYCRGTGRAL